MATWRRLRSGTGRLIVRECCEPVRIHHPIRWPTSPVDEVQRQRTRGGRCAVQQFSSQEPGKAEEIQSFAASTTVLISLVGKTKHRGGQKSDLYTYLLKDAHPCCGTEKVLVGRDGKVIDRFRSATGPVMKSWLLQSGRTRQVQTAWRPRR